MAESEKVENCKIHKLYAHYHFIIITSLPF